MLERTGELVGGMLERAGRSGKLYCSRSTFYKYAGLVRKHRRKTELRKTKLSIQSTRIFEFVHVDTTWLYTIKDGPVRAVIIKDNYSKKVLHQAVVDSGNSKWIALLLQEMFSIYKLYQYSQPITIVSDGGSENKGEVLNWINTFDKDAVIKKTAKTIDFQYTNNEIESTFNIFKNEYIGQTEIADKEHSRKLLKDFQLYNDNQRYPIALYGLIAQEVFDGAVPDKYRFRNDIQHAAKNRHIRNKSALFCDVCSAK